MRLVANQKVAGSNPVYSTKWTDTVMPVSPELVPGN